MVPIPIKEFVKRTADDDKLPQSTETENVGAAWPQQPAAASQRRTGPRPARGTKRASHTAYSRGRSLGRGHSFLLLQKGRKTQPTLRGALTGLEAWVSNSHVLHLLTGTGPGTRPERRESSRQAGRDWGEVLEQGLVRQGLASRQYGIDLFQLQKVTKGLEAG